MEPTIHKLFDAGAWTLTDDHRVLVSADYTGSETAVVRLREHFRL
jgi:predicted restriction endonuclease